MCMCEGVCVCMCAHVCARACSSVCISERVCKEDRRFGRNMHTSVGIPRARTGHAFEHW